MRCFSFITLLFCIYFESTDSFNKEFRFSVELFQWLDTNEKLSVSVSDTRGKGGIAQELFSGLPALTAQ